MPPELQEPPVQEAPAEETPVQDDSAQVDPQAELLEQEPAQKPSLDPQVLDLIERQQATIEELKRVSTQGQQTTKPAVPLAERLKAKGIDESTVKLFEAFAEELGVDLKGQFLERDYGHLLHHLASTNDQRGAIDAVRATHKATDAEINALEPHLVAVRKEYGNLPTKALYELAVTRSRAAKPTGTATGLTAARDAKTAALRKTPTLKNSPASLVADKLTDDDYEKLTPLQKTAYLNGKDPADFAGL